LRAALELVGRRVGVRRDVARDERLELGADRDLRGGAVEGALGLPDLRVVELLRAEALLHAAELVARAAHLRHEVLGLARQRAPLAVLRREELLLELLAEHVGLARAVIGGLAREIEGRALVVELLDELLEALVLAREEALRALDDRRREAEAARD